MSLPNEKGTATTIKSCCDAIGLLFPNDPQNQQLLTFPIGTLTTQIRQASGNTWNAAIEAFAGLILIRMIKDYSVVVDDFDETWFDKNQGRTIQDLVTFLTSNAIEI